jgi:hypothetical protein
MYTRDLVILANSIKYSGHCIAGKDLETGAWIRVINNQPRPFLNFDLKKLYGDPTGPSLLSCVKISFQEKIPLYYQPENELITGDPWEKIGDYPHEKIGLLEDIKYPCWLGNAAYGSPDNIHASICNSNLPLSTSLHLKKMNQSENNVTIAYKQHDTGYHPRLIFYLNNIRYDLGITDIKYPRLSSEDDTEPKPFPESYFTLGVGQLFEVMNAHYKLVVGIISSDNTTKRNSSVYPIVRSTNKSNGILQGDTSVMPSIPKPGVMKRPLPQLNIVTANKDEKLFLQLKNLRKSIADQACVPTYVIFPDKSLREMAHFKPCNLKNFGNISGVGSIKLEKYGLIFISLIKDFCEENGSEMKQPDIIESSDSSNVLERIYKLNQEISSITDTLKELTILKCSLLDQVKKTGIKQQGNYILQSSTVRVRQLNLEAFKQLYPLVFREIGSVKISDADRVIGKAEVKGLCTFKESTTYRVLKK